MTKNIKNLNFTALKIPTLAVLFTFLFTVVINEAYTQDIPLKIQSIPRQKDRIIIDNYQFDILSVSETRIETVKLKILR